MSWDRDRAKQICERLMEDMSTEREYIRDNLRDIEADEEEFALLCEQGLGMNEYEIADLIVEITGGD